MERLVVIEVSLDLVGLPLIHRRLCGAWLKIHDQHVLRHLRLLVCGARVGPVACITEPARDPRHLDAAGPATESPFGEQCGAMDSIHGRTVVVISGPIATGKSTVARAVAAELGI